MPDLLHLDFIKNTGTVLKTVNGQDIEIWELSEVKDEAVLRDVFNEFIQYVSNLGGEGIQKGCFWLIFKKSKISSILFFCCILGTFRSSWKRSSTIVLWAVALCPALRGMVFQSA